MEKRLIKIIKAFIFASKISVLALLIVNLFSASISINNLELSRIRHKEALSQGLIIKKPAFMITNSARSTFSNPVEIELNNRLLKSKEEKKIKVLKIKSTPKMEDHVEIKNADNLDTSEIKTMLEKHRGGIKITKHVDTL